jgi:adenylosuccinate lyase
MKAWDEGGDLQTLVTADKDISTHLTREQIAQVFDLKTYLRNVPAIFARVFG